MHWCKVYFYSDVCWQLNQQNTAVHHNVESSFNKLLCYKIFLSIKCYVTIYMCEYMHNTHSNILIYLSFEKQIKWNINSYLQLPKEKIIQVQWIVLLNCDFMRSVVCLSVQKSNERNKIIFITWQGMGWPDGFIVGLIKTSHTSPPQWTAHPTGQCIF